MDVVGGKESQGLFENGEKYSAVGGKSPVVSLVSLTPAIFIDPRMLDVENGHHIPINRSL